MPEKVFSLEGVFMIHLFPISEQFPPPPHLPFSFSLSFLLTLAHLELVLYPFHLFVGREKLAGKKRKRKEAPIVLGNWKR